MGAVRDPEATKARIFAAATAEFAAYGIAGARIDRIAREARANKQLIYAYYGNKAELFSQVLEKRLMELAVAIPVDAEDPDGWIDRLMDYHAAHPELVRLVFWEGLEYGTGGIPHEEERRRHYARKAAAFEEAQAKGVISAGIPAPDLLFLLIALASWSTVQPQMRRVLVGETDDDMARLRQSVRTAARRLTGTDAPAAAGAVAGPVA
ncbi:AcrR family transcriptional regulator [Streptomyces olivoverticillatus]|uniref:AcrR family transcriptional regulator n=1 Tax=Streptomyces olivoverticillatus TaxID=66427 RepID=A0A7W7LQW2_9ACTN|nr:TetR family transcriptional regulator [Streptomyces olivoverticillatus]MBB4894178.1 AcrR family transcriptional regulator [Streptomyces olivoverticillatus]